MFCRIEHEKLHAKHKGHEAMHMEMILILFSTLIVAQVLLVKWKKHYYKSFQVKKTVKLSSCQTMNTVIGFNTMTIQTYFRLSLYKFESETHFKSVAAIYNFKLKCIIPENIYTSLKEAIFSKTPNPLEIPITGKLHTFL